MRSKPQCSSQQQTRGADSIRQEGDVDDKALSLMKQGIVTVVLLQRICSDKGHENERCSVQHYILTFLWSALAGTGPRPTAEHEVNNTHVFGCQCGECSKGIVLMTGPTKS